MTISKSESVLVSRIWVMNTLLEDCPEKVQVQVQSSLNWLSRDSLEPMLQPKILLPSLLCWIEVFLQVKTFGGDNSLDKTLQIVFFCHTLFKNL